MLCVLLEDIQLLSNSKAVLFFRALLRTSLLGALGLWSGPWGRALAPRLTPADEASGLVPHESRTPVGVDPLSSFKATCGEREVWYALDWLQLDGVITIGQA